MPLEYNLMRPRKLAKEWPNQNTAASNPNPVLTIIEKFYQIALKKKTTEQNNQVPIKLFYRNQMTSYCKIEEKQLQQIIHNNIRSAIPDVHVKHPINY